MHARTSACILMVSRAMLDRSEHRRRTAMITIPDGKYLLKSASTDDQIVLATRLKSEHRDYRFGERSGPIVDRIVVTHRVGKRFEYLGKIDVVSGEIIVGLTAKDDMRLRRALTTFARLDSEQRLVCGEQYAETTGKCCICDRTLTAETSVVRGMGPICARRVLGKAVAA